MNPKRVRLIKKGISGNNSYGPVVYWMSRDQRAEDNWALIFANDLAKEQKSPFYVLFCIVPEFLNATAFHYTFMLNGLREISDDLSKKNIPFFVLKGDPGSEIIRFIKDLNPITLITDFDPLKIKNKWKEAVAFNTDAEIYEVDAHNIIPCWEASEKKEYGAYTLRPKIKKLLNEYLEDFPTLKKNKIPPEPFSNILKYYILNTYENLNIQDNRSSVHVYSNIRSGTRNAFRTFKSFIDKKIYRYGDKANDPNEDVLSDLSPYIHFGHIAPQRIVLEIEKLNIDEKVKGPFLEELVIRRELADNFCLYEENYDSFDGFPQWSKNTLDIHRADKRDHLYSLSKFENADTHDALWNSSQKEMVKTGKMHGYMRMYWAKKILEWTKNPEEAQEYAIYLNDRYELDGRDPNGYTGIAWSIGGLHDRAWNERPVFGKIRYMSYEGCKRKFDISSYIKKINNI